MKFLTASSLGLSALLLGLSQTPARGFTLDTFSDANVELAPGVEQQLIEADFLNPYVFDVDTNLSGTDFGERRLDLTLKTNGTGGSIDVFSISGVSSTASVSSNAVSTIDNAKFTWGSDSATPRNFRDISGHDSLAIEILSIDLVEGAEFTFTVTDSQATPQTATIADRLINSVGTQYFSYSDFEANNPNINLNSIEKVELTVVPQIAAFDTTFDFIQSAQEVPFEFSPTLGIILGGSFIGFNILRKRSQQK